MSATEQLRLFAFPALRTMDSPCADCGTYLPYMYMVRDGLWPQGRSDGGSGPMDGTLCIPCLERRLGRELAAEDFEDVPANAWVLRALLDMPELRAIEGGD